MTAPIGAGKRGRPPAEELRKKLARLEKEIVAVRAAVREADQRRYVILGETVAAEAGSNPEFRKTLAEILARRVTAQGAKAEIAPLMLPVLPAAAAPNPPAPSSAAT